MINIQISGETRVKIKFVYKSNDNTKEDKLNQFFSAEFLSVFPLVEDGITIIVGLGEPDTLTCRKAIDAVAKSVRQLKSYNLNEASVDLSPFLEKFGTKCVLLAVLGVKLGLYGFYDYRTEETKQQDYRFRFNGVGDPHGPAAKQLFEAVNLADGVSWARDLVNSPANYLTPEKFADLLIGKAKECGVESAVLDENEAEHLGMGAFLAVGKSSGNPPRLIVLRYLADPSSDEITALVGKGVTCDTGGYCLKSKSSMPGIKGDMAGGAAVANAVFALAQNRIKTNVIGVIPAVENRISSQSFVPGDILCSMSGKTIEIRDTDAEGRLILADAVTYAIRKEHATRILDIATLTGSVVNALGFHVAGVLSNDDAFYNELIDAASVTGEQYWRLPCYPEYDEMLKSEIADIRNLGENYCGTITAGLFIKAFTESLPWLHIDIAGTAWVDQPKFEHQSAGATGAAVTTLYYLLSKNK